MDYCVLIGIGECKFVIGSCLCPMPAAMDSKVPQKPCIVPLSCAIGITVEVLPSYKFFAL